MNGNAFVSYLMLGLLAAIIAGCGSGGSSGVTAASTPNAVAVASAPCIGCHGAFRSSVTGVLVTDDWQASTHHTKNGASCRDCHEPAAGHPNNCNNSCHGGGNPANVELVYNPDRSQKCYKCHGLNFPADIMIAKAPQHFGNLTTALSNTTYRAQYVSSLYVGNCRKCHNPHNPSAAIEISRQWAQSGMGDTKSGARQRYDFKTRGTYQPVNETFQFYCVRCHTSTGYIKFVTSGFTDLAPFAGPGFAVVQNSPQPVVPAPPDLPSPDKTKEVTACNVCHDDGNGNAYGFALRAVPPVRIYYNVSTAWTVPTIKLNNSPVDYPDKGASNMCLPCHTGRGIGQLIKDAATAGLNFASAPSISAHDRDTGAILARHGGYEFPGRDYANPDTYLHEFIGMNNTRGTGTLGPCIVCHMKSSESHSFEPVTKTVTTTTNIISGIKSQACARCHDGSFQPAWDGDGTNLQKKRAGEQASLAALAALLKAKGVPKTINSTLSLRNWEFPYGAGTGPNTMGANFNSSLLVNEPGAYVHNDTYAKRLIYDSIDWLNNGALDDDVVAAINALTFPAGTKNPVTGIAYTPTELANLKTDAIGYLLKNGLRP